MSFESTTNCCGSSFIYMVWGVVDKEEKSFYHINYLRISTHEKSRNSTYEKYDMFSRVFDIANQLLTRHKITQGCLWI